MQATVELISAESCPDYALTARQSRPAACAEIFLLGYTAPVTGGRPFVFTECAHADRSFNFTAPFHLIVNGLGFGLTFVGAVTNAAVQWQCVEPVLKILRLCRRC